MNGVRIPYDNVIDEFATTNGKGYQEVFSFVLDLEFHEFLNIDVKQCIQSKIEIMFILGDILKFSKLPRY